MKDGLTDKRGQGVLELIIALSILTITLAAGLVVVFGGQSLLLDASKSQRAMNFARENLENARADAYRDWANLQGSSSTQREFVKEIIVENSGADTKKVTSRVTWDAGPLHTGRVELVTLVTNWKAIQETGGDPGGGGVSGDWKNPRTLGSVDLGPGNEATDVDAKNKIVYLTTEASDVKKHDFYVVDATNGSNPAIVSSIDTGPGPCPTPSTGCGPGLNAIDVAGNYAYVVGDDTSNQLQVIDISSPSNPQMVRTYQLPDVSGPGAVGQSIYYLNGKLYIGTKAAVGPEFHIVDVTSPTSPQSVGNKEIGADVNSISVAGGKAYLATSDDGEEVKIFDVTNAGSPLEIGSFNAPGAGDGKSLHLVGDRLYVGRKTGGSPEFYILDVASSASILTLSSSTLGTDVNSLFVRDNLGFFSTSDANRDFQVWNVNPPASSSLWSFFDFPQLPSGIDYEDNTVYVSVRSNDALRIITSGP